ncbi:MAG: hypothetical protein ACI9I4_001141, partial [Neolewinella sp.]
NYGIYNDSASPIINDSSILAGSKSFDGSNYAVYNTEQSHPIINRSKFKEWYGDHTYGFYNLNSSPG